MLILYKEIFTHGDQKNISTQDRVALTTTGPLEPNP
jgi:hypothetical protein